MATALPDFPQFDPDREPTSIAQRWKKWIGRLDNLLVALDIQTPARQKALLLHYAGPGTQEINENLPDPPPTNGDEQPSAYEEAKTQLNNYFNPKSRGT